MSKITLQVDEYEELVRACEKAEARAEELEHELKVLRDIEHMANGAIRLGAERTMERDRYRAAITEMVEAYGEMEKGIDDPILCHYNGIRLHNAMEDLRALVIPGYEPKYEPNVDEIADPE